MLKSDYFRIEIYRLLLFLDRHCELKSDYFRIEIKVIWFVWGAGLMLKSDYFRIEIKEGEDNLIGFIIAQIRLF